MRPDGKAALEGATEYVTALPPRSSVATNCVIVEEKVVEKVVRVAPAAGEVQVTPAPKFRVVELVIERPAPFVTTT